MFSAIRSPGCCCCSPTTCWSRLAELGPWARVGQIVAPMLKPVFAVGFLAAAWTQERGGSPQVRAPVPRLSQQPLRAHSPRHRVSRRHHPGRPGDDARRRRQAHRNAFRRGKADAKRRMLGGQLQLAMLFGGVCALPTLFALWFAPALVVFEDAGAAAARWRRASARRSPTGARSRSMARWCSPSAACCRAWCCRSVSCSAIRSPACWRCSWSCRICSRSSPTLHISDYVSYRDVFHPDEPRIDVSHGAGNG